MLAREMSAFLDCYDPSWDRLFRAEEDGHFLGSLTIEAATQSSLRHIKESLTPIPELENSLG